MTKPVLVLLVISRNSVAIFCDFGKSKLFWILDYILADSMNVGLL